MRICLSHFNTMLSFSNRRKKPQPWLRLALLSCALLASCAKGTSSQLGGSSPTQPQGIEKSEAVPTETDFTEESPLILTNGKTRIEVGFLKVQDLTYTYDRGSEEVEVKGKITLTESKQQTKDRIVQDIHLKGPVKSGYANLFPVIKENKSSDETPHFRAKVTCLTLTEDLQFDCQEAIIDVFARYKNRTHTDQLEARLNKKKLISRPRPDQQPPSSGQSRPIPVNPNTPSEKDPKTGPTAPPRQYHSEPDDQSHSNESPEESQSVPSRFVGRASEDLDDIFPEEVSPSKDSSPTPKDSPNGKPPKKDSPSTPAPKTPPATPPSGSKAGCPSNMVCLPDGNLRPALQAFLSANDGFLRNASSITTKAQILKDRASFVFNDPKSERRFGTYEAIEFVQYAGNEAGRLIKNYKIVLGDIAQARGGALAGSAHGSHQNGLDIDFAYPTRSHLNGDKTAFKDVVDTNGRLNSNELLIDQTWKLFKSMIKNPHSQVGWIFVDRSIKLAMCNYAEKTGDLRGPEAELAMETLRRLHPSRGHENHFHVRLKCSPYDKRCLDQKDPQGIRCTNI